jgi:NAD(P)-dependent dehydrogenase (short-subunit alcohol dehydrogenase family)
MGPTLQGRVIVIAGDETVLGAVARAALDAGAFVAVVSRTLPDDAATTVRFRADPDDRGMWDRVAMHVEQHLGPVDGVVTDSRHRAVVAAVFATDLSQRGHGGVVTVSPDESPDDVLIRVDGTQRAAPAPPPAVDPGR